MYAVIELWKWRTNMKNNKTLPGPWIRLRVLLKIQSIYAYNFEGRRYDVGDKQGFLEASVEYALRYPDLRDGFLKYLEEIVAKEK